MKNKMTILYVRCSLGDNRQDLNHQIETCTRYATDNGMTIDKVIKDEGVSAFSTSYLDRRIMEVIELASQNKVENLICFSTDRLAREHLQGQIIINQLSQYNVKVYSASEGFVNGSQIDKLLNSIRFFQSELESEKTSLRIRSKKELMKKEGLWLGNHLPTFGYKIDDNKKIIVNEEQRSIVLDFFTTYLNYGNAYTVSHMKEKYGISICRCVDLIKNKTFIGYPYLDSEYYFDYLQIVPNDLWNKCQEVIKQRKTKGETKTDKSQALLESILYHCCNNGNSKMYISYDKGNKYCYYRCNKCRGTDYKKTFTQWKVDDIVDKQISQWFERLDKEELLERFNNTRNKNLKDMRAKEKRQSELLGTKKKTLHNANDRLTEALNKNYPLDMIKVITDSINSLKNSIEELEQELEELKENIANEQNVTDKQIQLSEQLLDFKYLYANATILEKKILIRNIVDKVIITDYDNIEIIYKY